MEAKKGGSCGRGRRCKWLNGSVRIDKTRIRNVSRPQMRNYETRTRTGSSCQQETREANRKKWQQNGRSKRKNRSEIKKENSSSSIIICPGLGILYKPHTHTHTVYSGAGGGGGLGVPERWTKLFALVKRQQTWPQLQWHKRNITNLHKMLNQSERAREREGDTARKRTNRWS